MSLVSERLYSTPDARIPLLDWLRLLIRRLVCVGELVRVDPHLYLNDSRTVIKLVCDVGGLRADVAYFPDKCDLSGLAVVDHEMVGVWVGMLCIKELFDGDRPESVLAVPLFGVAAVALTAWHESTAIGTALRAIACRGIAVICVENLLASRNAYCGVVKRLTHI